MNNEDLSRLIKNILSTSYVCEYDFELYKHINLEYGKYLEQYFIEENIENHKHFRFNLPILNYNYILKLYITLYPILHSTSFTPQIPTLKIQNFEWKNTVYLLLLKANIDLSKFDWENIIKEYNLQQYRCSDIKICDFYSTYSAVYKYSDFSAGGCTNEQLLRFLEILLHVLPELSWENKMFEIYSFMKN